MKFTNLTETKKEQLALIELPYALDALEPVMSKNTVKYHYEVLSQGYVDRFNNGEGDPAFNRAGTLLHCLWWAQLAPPKINNLPKGISKLFIDDKFGDFDSFKDKFIEESKKLQGSGWCYLAKDGNIGLLKNQTWKSNIILAIDLWEHSFYLDYPADKDKYLKNIWRCINWNVVNDRINLN